MVTFIVVVLVVGIAVLGGALVYRNNKLKAEAAISKARKFGPRGE